jgi:hypothetical protein
MYVKRIVEDSWSGARSGEFEYECNNLRQIVAAVKKLNGHNKTSVYLQADGEKSLTVSGGNDGRYVAFVTVGVDDEFYNLVDLGRPEGQTLEVVAGGQTGAFPAKQCVGLETALEAARQFALDGSMAPSLAWERQA